MRTYESTWVGDSGVGDSGVGDSPRGDSPISAEAGGLASGKEAYWSFDGANIHCVALGSVSLDSNHVNAMLTWLQNYLLSGVQDWVIAIWHHPPFSKGKHDSDDPGDSGGRLVAMREEVVPILEDHGVDQVFSGHSHSHEHSHLIDGHYGDSTEFAACDDAGTPLDPADDSRVNDPGTACPGGILDRDLGGYLVDAGDGRAGGDGSCVKPVLGVAPLGRPYSPSFRPRTLSSVPLARSSSVWALT